MSRVIIRLEQINVSSRGREAAFTWAPTSSLADGEVTQCCAGDDAEGAKFRLHDRKTLRTVKTALRERKK